MDIRVKDNVAAISTELDATRSWFFLSTTHGGYYGDGLAEKVEDWQPAVLDPGWTPPAVDNTWPPT